MANLKSVIVFLAMFEVLYLASASSKGKGQRHYNEQCVPYDSVASCDSTQGLICLDSGLKGYRCLCPTNKLHAQLFDTKRNACVGKVLNSCVRGSSKSSLNETLCVDHAECNTEVYGMAVCLCKAGFTERDDGTCRPSLKYGDPCDSDKDDDTSSEKESSATVQGQCDEKHGMACTEGKCACKFPSEQYYDAKERKCISKAGGRCSQDGHIYTCVTNANCPNTLRKLGSIGVLGLPPLPPFLSAFASASAGAGGGDEIYVMPLRPRLPPPPPPPHRHTLHHHPHPPHHHRPLGKEDALMEYDTSFDNYDYVARSIFFGSQNKKQGAGNEGEESADSLDPNQPRCQCLPGFTRTADGFCLKGYGNKCNPEDDDMMANQKNNNDSLANSRPRELCNADQFLECMDAHDGSFTCQCRNPMNERFDPERNECVAIVSRRCRSLGNYPKCESGSECVDGICVCANGTSLTPMDTCLKSYEQKCEPGECNMFKGLVCHGKSKTCLCVDSYMRYDPKKNACVTSKGSICGSVRSATSWSNNFMPEMAYVECESGSECKPREVGGKRLPNMCM